MSRLATFGMLIGWCARACMALTCAYVAELDDHRPGVLLKVANCDTAYGVSLVACGVSLCWG